MAAMLKTTNDRCVTVLRTGGEHAGKQPVLTSVWPGYDLFYQGFTEYRDMPMPTKSNSVAAYRNRLD